MASSVRRRSPVDADARMDQWRSRAGGFGSSSHGALFDRRAGIGANSTSWTAASPTSARMLRRNASALRRAEAGSCGGKRAPRSTSNRFTVGSDRSTSSSASRFSAASAGVSTSEPGPSRNVSKSPRLVSQTSAVATIFRRGTSARCSATVNPKGRPINRVDNSAGDFQADMASQSVSIRRYRSFPTSGRHAPSSSARAASIGLIGEGARRGWPLRRRRSRRRQVRRTRLRWRCHGGAGTKASFA
jgi:hypothetical protein